MEVSLFDYELPARLIAQDPATPRDASRLLLVPPEDQELGHHRFADLPRLLRPGDLLVLNDTRVIPARLWGRKETGGRVEILALSPVRSPAGERSGDRVECWRCLLRAARRPPRETRIRLSDGSRVRVVQAGPGAEVILEFEETPVLEVLERSGETPLPPYIKRAPGDPRLAGDRRRYQTIFARKSGAVAAPTAGLHFTRRVLEELAARQVETAFLTLQVGPGTFRPVTARRVEDHRVDPEPFELPIDTAAAVARARRRGGRVVACGTTVARVLEARAEENGTVVPGRGTCRLVILPNHRFRVVDRLVTNFHLPRTSLLMLVCALAGRTRVLAAYREAVLAGYRFYSYGDAMLVSSRMSAHP
ncbi:MAG: tRNA preQ1(34) S-adenosylmethionine ribosyltransferase-isomerase QueA [Acidobacteriota bacterium]